MIVKEYEILISLKERSVLREAYRLATILVSYGQDLQINLY